MSLEAAAAGASCRVDDKAGSLVLETNRGGRTRVGSKMDLSNRHARLLVTARVLIIEPSEANPPISVPRSTKLGLGQIQALHVPIQPRPPTISQTSPSSAVGTAHQPPPLRQLPIVGVAPRRRFRCSSDSDRSRRRFSPLPEAPVPVVLALDGRRRQVCVRAVVAARKPPYGCGVGKKQPPVHGPC